MEESSSQKIERLLKERKKLENQLKFEMYSLEIVSQNLEMEKPVTEIARQKLKEEKKQINARKHSLALAFEAHLRSHESMLRLMEERKRIHEETLKDILELEKEMAYKHQLEIDIQSLKGTLQVMEYMADEDDEDDKLRMREINEELKKKCCELEETMAGRVIRDCNEEPSSGCCGSD